MSFAQCVDAGITKFVFSYPSFLGMHGFVSLVLVGAEEAIFTPSRDLCNGALRRSTDFARSSQIQLR